MGVDTQGTVSSPPGGEDTPGNVIPPGGQAARGYIDPRGQNKPVHRKSQIKNPESRAWFDSISAM